MKKITNILLLLVIGFTFNAQAQNEVKTGEFDDDILNWKTDLINSREVGPPCEENIPKWIKENPDLYYGMQEIKQSITDFNNDGIYDGLFYFKGMNCVGVPKLDSDFGMLIYSKNNERIIDREITETIEKLVNTTLEDTYTVNIDHSKVYYKIFNKGVIGEFVAWRASDALCCASFSGIFEYDISSENINLTKIEIKKE